MASLLLQIDAPTQVEADTRSPTLPNDYEDYPQLFEIMQRQSFRHPNYRSVFSLVEAVS
jgi:hypothetical protein